MSAFICSPEHISTIVHWGLTHPTWHPAINNRDFIARQLAEENINSIAHRYPDMNSKESDEFLDMPREDYISACAKAPHNCLDDPIKILKLIDSLNYQSCEHPGWESSAAYEILNTLRAAAIRELPGYDEAEWAI